MDELAWILLPARCASFAFILLRVTEPYCDIRFMVYPNSLESPGFTPRMLPVVLMFKLKS